MVEWIDRKVVIFLVIFLLSISSVVFIYAEGGESQTSPHHRISLEEVLRQSLAKNFDIRLARIEQEINLLNLPAARSVYDTLLSADLNYAYYNLKKSSQYSGSLNKIGNYGLGVSKLLPWGTSLSLEFGNQYYFSDSAFTTVLGLVSVAYMIGGGDPFIRPATMAIVWGLSFATLLTLVLIPCVYAIMDDITLRFFHHGTVRGEDRKWSRD